MKRALLIAGGTVGGLGAVLSITPPALSNSGLNSASSTSLPQSATQVKQSAQAVVTQTPSASPTATSVKKKTKKSKKKTTTTTSSNVTTTSTTTASATKTVSGSFTGDAINVGYGIVQVRITVQNGKITDAQAVQAPTGRSQRFTDYALPNLRQQTLQAQSSNIQGVSGASYTSYGWYKSLISALQKAGLGS